MITWQQRYKEWKALLNYCSENRKELESKGRMPAFIWCLQRHYEDYIRLKG